MIVKLKNGFTISVLGVHGQNCFYQGVNRDCLIFLFDPSVVSLSDLAQAFTAENCQTISIEEEENCFLHENYTIRLAIGQGFQAEALGNQIGKDDRQCVFVKMAQSTLAERQILQQQETLDALLIATLEGNE